MDDQRLRPVERLYCPQAYQRVFAQGEKLVGALFVLYVLPTAQPYSRLGLAVSKRLGKAVVRNRIKRYLREMFRHHKTVLPAPCDLVCVARREAVGVPYMRYPQQFLTLVQRCQCLGR